jgi:hypothetical protein
MSDKNTRQFTITIPSKLYVELRALSLRRSVKDGKFVSMSDLFVPQFVVLLEKIVAKGNS